MKSLLENKTLPDNIILPKEFEVRNELKPTTQSDTFYNLKDFTNEQKVVILDKMLAKGDALSEEDALDQLNQMLATNKEFATKYIKSCLS
jgi:hypothetical protein